MMSDDAWINGFVPPNCRCSTDLVVPTDLEVWQRALAFAAHERIAAKIRPHDLDGLISHLYDWDGIESHRLHAEHGDDYAQFLPLDELPAELMAWSWPS